MTGAASETTTDVNGTDVMTYYVTSDKISHNGKEVTFPASGRRTSSGNLYFVGSFGDYWSSSASDGTLAYNLGFDSSGVYPNGTSERSLGYSLKCVRE
jgi:hypothetical protein